MPQQPEIPAQFFIERLKNFSIFESNSLKKSNDPIWAQIKESLKLDMKAESIHLFVYNNRSGARLQLEKYFNISRVESKRIREGDIDDEYNPRKKLSNQYNCEKKTFMLVCKQIK